MKSGIDEFVLDEPAATFEGTAPIDGVGLLTTCLGSDSLARLASVAMLEADMLRAGLAGRILASLCTAAAKGEGDAAAFGWMGVGCMIPEPLLVAECRGAPGTHAAAAIPVGVGWGVEVADELAFDTEIGAGDGRDAELAPTGPW